MVGVFAGAIVASGGAAYAVATTNDQGPAVHEQTEALSTQAPQGSHQQPPVTRAPRGSTEQLEKAFKIFSNDAPTSTSAGAVAPAANATATDVDAVANGGSGYGVDHTAAKEITTPYGLVSVTPGSSGACLSVSLGKGQSSSTCLDTDSVLEGRLISTTICSPALERGQILVSGLVPDRATSVKLEFAAGGSVVRPEANTWTYVGTPPVAASWIDASGKAVPIAIPMPSSATGEDPTRNCAPPPAE